MSDTPRTNRQVQGDEDDDPPMVVHVEFARELERDLTTARARIAALEVELAEREGQLEVSEAANAIANNKLHTLARCVDLSEKIMESQTEQQVALMTDFDAAMQQVVLDEAERDLAATRAREKKLIKQLLIATKTLRQISMDWSPGGAAEALNQIVELEGNPNPPGFSVGF